MGLGSGSVHSTFRLVLPGIPHLQVPMILVNIHLLVYIPWCFHTINSHCFTPGKVYANIFNSTKIVSGKTSVTCLNSHIYKLINMEIDMQAFSCQLFISGAMYWYGVVDFKMTAGPVMQQRLLPVCKSL